MARSLEEIKEYQKKYKLAHKKQRQEYDQIRYVEDKTYFKNKNSNYYLEHKEYISIDRSIYYLNNKEVIKDYRRLYIKDKRANDVSFNLRSQVSKNINRILKSQGSSKNGSSVLQHLPYSMQELKNHLESQFESWMTWNNWGRYDLETWNDNDSSTWTWNIDHIVPQSKLLYTNMTDDNFKKCWSLSNLRTLSSKQNLIDGDRRC
jgi:hypothetical protein